MAVQVPRQASSVMTQLLLLCLMVMHIVDVAVYAVVLHAPLVQAVQPKPDHLDVHAHVVVDVSLAASPVEAAHIVFAPWVADAASLADDATLEEHATLAAAAFAAPVGCAG